MTLGTPLLFSNRGRVYHTTSIFATQLANGNWLSQWYKSSGQYTPQQIAAMFANMVENGLILSSPSPLKGRYFVKRAGKRVRPVGTGVAGKKGGDPCVALRPVPLPLRTCPLWATQASPLYSAPLPPLRM